ncbi:unnamed protein product [Rangifer tarandus platyrhynchus]|uniref:Uncharacterized protein n=1 Tax=Rangifer tarandus platyrhynchus TaxID=3082113 RepID=A0ACB1MK24_RANTA
MELRLRVLGRERSTETLAGALEPVSPGRPQGEATPREMCPTSPEAPVTPLLAEAWPLSSRTESLSCRGPGAGSLRTQGGLLTPERRTAQGFFLIRHSQGRAYTPLHN